MVFRHQLCTVRLYWVGGIQINWMNFGMQHAPGAGSTARPIGLQSSTRVLSYGCPFHYNETLLHIPIVIRDFLFVSSLHLQTLKCLKRQMSGTRYSQYSRHRLQATNTSVQRQKGLTVSHLHTQLDPFASKLTRIA